MCREERERDLAVSPLRRRVDSRHGITSSNDAAQECLQIYLDDHRAGVAAPSRPELASFDLEAMESDADDQLAVLGRVHEWASSPAFGMDDPAGSP